MKTLSLLTIALVLFVGAGSEVYGQCDRNINSPIRCGYYDEGFQDGVSDAQNRRSNDYQRYRNKFERQYESFYRDGYRAGYASIPTWGRWTPEQRSAYDTGYNVGFSDRQLGRSSAPESRQGESAFNVRPYFFQGYMDGYSGVPRRYDFEIGNPGGGGGWPGGGGGGGWPGGGGGSVGSVIWNGRVDDRARVYVQGNRTWVENITGNGATQSSVQWQGSLPRRDTTVNARLLSGRGSATVVEQPNRFNNYRAAIEISDPQGGAANYRLEVSWQQSAANPNYAPGRATWRGRVDDRVNIYISGSEIWDETISGGMTQNAFGTVIGYLAARNGSVTVNRRSGRGTVTVIQQPSRANGFTAVIQISDPRSGADDYEIDVSW
jgi:hypothetical protein